MELADWLLQIEKVALLTHNQEYKLAKAKSESTSYKMLNRLGSNTDWQDIKKKEEVYSPLTTEVHTASDLPQKQRPDETLQDVIQNFTDLTEKAMRIDLANITNHVIIFLFIKNLYNKDIRLQVAGAKTISTLVDAFTLAHHSLLKLKKYEGFVYQNEDTIAEINRITHTMTKTKVNYRPKTPDRDLQNKTNKNYTFWGNCWKCGELGHSTN